MTDFSNNAQAIQTSATMHNSDAWHTMVPHTYGIEALVCRVAYDDPLARCHLRPPFHTGPTCRATCRGSRSMALVVVGLESEVTLLHDVDVYAKDLKAHFADFARRSSWRNSGPPACIPFTSASAYCSMISSPLVTEHNALSGHTLATS
jgi:hypothetical protein